MENLVSARDISHPGWFLIPGDLPYDLMVNYMPCTLKRITDNKIARKKVIQGNNIVKVKKHLSRKGANQIPTSSRNQI